MPRGARKARKKKKERGGRVFLRKREVNRQLECLVHVPGLHVIRGKAYYSRCRCFLDEAQDKRLKEEEEYELPEGDLRRDFVDLGEAIDLEGFANDDAGHEKLVANGLKEEVAAPFAEFLASEMFQDWLGEQVDLCIDAGLFPEDGYEAA